MTIEAKVILAITLVFDVLIIGLTLGMRFTKTS